MTKSGRLIEQLRRVGPALDSATDPEAMRFLIRGRKALTAAIEEARPADDLPPASNPLRLTDEELRILREEGQDCRKCGATFLPGGNGRVYPKLCCTCDIIRVERMVLAVLKRHGRKRGLAMLREMGRPELEPEKDDPMADAALMERHRLDMIERNAKGPRLPCCRKCRFPIDPDNHGTLYPRRCWSCDFDDTWPLIERLVERWGAYPARLKLRALASEK